MEILIGDWVIYCGNFTINSPKVIRNTKNGFLAPVPPLRSSSLGSFPTPSLPILFSLSGCSQVKWQGGVIMATLRALVGAGTVLAFMGFVVFVPVGWAVVLVAASATP